MSLDMSLDGLFHDIQIGIIVPTLGNIWHGYLVYERKPEQNLEKKSQVSYKTDAISVLELLPEWFFR